jgi:hypothetical protein
MELQEPNSPEPQAYSPPVTETGQQRSASVSWSRTTEIVGGRSKDGTPPVEVLFRNMTSCAIVVKHAILCETRP